MNLNKSEQFELYKQLFEKQENRKVDLVKNENRKELALFIKEKRVEIKKIINSNEKNNFKQEDWKINWFDLIASQREVLWLAKKISYKHYNIYHQLIDTGSQNINFDDFLRMTQNCDLKKWKWWEISDNLNHLVNNWWWSDFHSISEVISNAIDATNPENVIWRFWKWFFQILRFLDDTDTTIVIHSKKESSKAHKIIFENSKETWDLNDDLNITTSSEKKDKIWTTVEVQKKLTPELKEEIIEYIKQKFKTNKNVNLKLNWEKINHLDEYEYINWKKLVKQNKEVVIEITENWIKIIDNWVWMDSQDLSTKLLFPNDSSKKIKKLKWKELKNWIKKEASFFYKKWELKEKEEYWITKTEKTEINFMIWWTIVETFDVDSSSDIKEFVVEFPSFTYLMENKNEISLTDEVIETLVKLLEDTSKLEKDWDKIKLIELIWKIINHLKNNSSWETWNIDRVLKKNFKNIKKDLETDWKKVLSSELKGVIWEKENIIYVSQDLENLNFKNIPWVKKLKNINNSTRPFYSTDFWKNSKYSYLINEKWILVDEKKLNKQELIQILNIAINLNVWYEISSKTVFYWEIIDWKWVLLENWKKIISEENKINSNSENNNLNNIADLNKNSDLENSNSNNKNLENNKITEQEKIQEILNEKILDKYLDLKDEYKKLSENIENKYKKLINSKLKENEIFNKEWDFTINTLFFLLSEFSFEDLLEYTNKENYLEYLENVSNKEQNSILKFQYIIKNNTDKWEKLDKILEYLQNDKSKTSIIELIGNLPKDSSLFDSYNTLLNLDENNKNIDLYSLYKTNIKLFIWYLEKETWKKVLDISDVLEIDWWIIWIIELDDKKYLFEKKDWWKLKIIKKKTSKWEEIKKFTDIQEINWIIVWTLELFDWRYYMFERKDWWEIEVMKKTNEWEEIEYIWSIIKTNFWITWNIELWKENISYLYEKDFFWNMTIFRKTSEWEKIEDISEVTNIEWWTAWTISLLWNNDNIFLFEKKDWWEIKGIKKTNKWEIITSIWDIVNIKWTINGHIQLEWDDNYYLFEKKNWWDIEVIKTTSDLRVITFISDIIKIDWWISWRIQLEWDDNYYLFEKKNWWDVEIWKRDINENYISYYNEIVNWTITWQIQLVWEENSSSFIKAYNQEMFIFWKDKWYSNIENFKKEIWNTSFNFVEFLEKWGEFLENKELDINFEWENKLENSFNLSELMYLNKLKTKDFNNVFDTENSEQNEEIKEEKNILNKKASEEKNEISEEENSILNNFKNLFNEELKEKNLWIYNRKIFSQIEWQDKVNQIWIREVIQNSVDAIRKNWGEEVNVDFYENDWHFVSKIEDPVWMSYEEIFKYLLPIWTSWKTEWDTWKFGQWFYSLLIWAKEVNLKTSKWDWKTAYLNIKPVYNEDWLLNDFKISYDIKDKYYKWTTIERIDNAEWVEWNLKAMGWINNLEKYVGTVEWVKINYNWEQINWNNEILEEEKVWELWNIKLIKNWNYERITKDGLFMSYMKEEYTDLLPNWIIEIIKKDKLTIDIPSKIDLVASINEIANKADLKKIKLHIFNIVTKYIVKQAINWNLEIEMLPQDFFSQDRYPKNHKSIKLANKINSGQNLEWNDFEYLKNQVDMSLFLANLEINQNWTKVSLAILKRKRDDTDFIKENSSWTMNDYVQKWSERAENKKQNNTIILAENEIKNNTSLINFRKNILDDFSKLYEKVLWIKLDSNNIWFFDWNKTDLAHANSFNQINFNTIFLEYLWNKSKLIDTFCHELSHLVEFKRFNKWSTHEKWEHNSSFESINREVLEIYLRLEE